MPRAAPKKEMPSAKAMAEMIWMKWWISLLMGVCSAPVSARYQTASASASHGAIGQDSRRNEERGAEPAAVGAQAAPVRSALPCAVLAQRRLALLRWGKRRPALGRRALDEERVLLGRVRRLGARLDRGEAERRAENGAREGPNGARAHRERRLDQGLAVRARAPWESQKSAAFVRSSSRA